MKTKTIEAGEEKMMTIKTNVEIKAEVVANMERVTETGEMSQMTGIRRGKIKIRKSTHANVMTQRRDGAGEETIQTRMTTTSRDHPEDGVTAHQMTLILIQMMTEDPDEEGGTATTLGEEDIDLHHHLQGERVSHLNILLSLTNAQT
jgi:hypothetical protein